MAVLLTPEEASEHLGISIRQLRDLTDEGVLRWINIGKGGSRPTRRYTVADMEAFIEERAIKCRSTNAKAPTLTHMTSGFKVVDLRATLAQVRSAKQAQSKATGKTKPRHS